MKGINSVAALDASVQGIHYRNALAAIKMVGASAVLDLTEDDFNFLINDKLWIATDRTRARRCVEAAIYGALDYLSLPRFAVPAEYIAAAIAYYVKPVNIMFACLLMEGGEWSDCIINGVERSVSGRELFAHVLRLKAGDATLIDAADAHVRRIIKEQGL